MNAKLVSFLKFILLLAIAFGLLWFVFRGMDPGRILQEMKHANWLFLFLSIFLSLVALVSRAYRWQLLIESAGHQSSLKNTTAALMVGYFANLAFPRLGEVTRCGSLSKAQAIPFNMLLGTVIVERTIDVISLLICILLTAIIEADHLGNFIGEKIIGPIVDRFTGLMHSPLFLSLALVGLVLLILLFFYLRKSRHSRQGASFYRLLKGLGDGLKSVAKLKRPWLFVFHSVFIWVLYYFSMYLSFFALPFTSGLGPGAALLLLVAGGIGMSAPVQGGIGIYHLLVSQGLMLYGLTREQGLVFATLVHGSQILIIVVLGSLSLLVLFLGNKKTNQQAVSQPRMEA